MLAKYIIRGLAGIFLAAVKWPNNKLSQAVNSAVSAIDVFGEAEKWVENQFGLAGENILREFANQPPR
ncbi:hypothetical protein [Paraburkholderia bonniea]|uniref:hypothetical protein n=1 Tax=Paraburkholderia bonniea TaxID=2152891 RepID=UPI001290C08B|nr:hypothetical protein [Paraburkholderia bonniea]